MATKVKAMRAMAKAVTYRLLGAIETFGVAWFFTGHLGAAGALAGVQAFTHTAIYVGHEFAWEWAGKEGA